MTEPPDHRDPEDAARRERTRAYQRAWDNANRERVNADKRQRYAVDPDYRTTQVGYRRAWEEANRDRVNAAKRDRRAADPEYRATGRTWWEANRERINADKRQRYATDSDYRAKILAAQKKTRRAGELRRKYGLSLQDYDRMFARQRGICPMCWKKFKRTPCVDHSHVTGLVRGLLCRNCNIGFGNFFENPAFLRRAADYGEFFAAHIEELLRGDPAARQELARLQEAMLRTDMTRLLPPHGGKRGKSGARAKAPPEETADRTVKSSAKSKRPKPR